MEHPGWVVTSLVMLAGRTFTWPASRAQAKEASAAPQPVQVHTGSPQAWPSTPMVRASRVVSFLPSASLNSLLQTEHTQWALTPVSVQVAGTSATAVRV